jgi:hypothetical protein
VTNPPTELAGRLPNIEEVVERVTANARKHAKCGCAIFVEQSDLRALLNASREVQNCALCMTTLNASRMASPAVDTLHVVFDGPPGHESGRFVECEAPDGRSVGIGEWHERGDGYWELRIPLQRPAVDVGELGKAIGYALHICPTIEPDAYARDLTAAEHEYIAKTALERLTTMGDNSRG